MNFSSKYSHKFEKCNTQGHATSLKVQLASRNLLRAVALTISRGNFIAKVQLYGCTLWNGKFLNVLYLSMMWKKTMESRSVIKFVSKTTRVYSWTISDERRKVVHRWILNIKRRQKTIFMKIEIEFRKITLKVHWVDNLGVAHFELDDFKCIF